MSRLWTKVHEILQQRRRPFALSNAVSSRAAVGATLIRIEGVQWTVTKQNSEVGKTSGPVLSRLWTKVHEILQQCRRPFALSNAVARLSVSCFIQQIFAIKCRSRRKPNKCKSLLAPNFFSGGTTPTFLRHIVRAAYCPPFDKVWLSSVC